MEKYPTDEDLKERFEGTEDAEALKTIGSYYETIAVLARRGVLDPSLLCDAVGLSIRERWETIRKVVERRRRIHDNPYILENMEWLALYSTWWKDTPRNPRERNYNPNQFRDVTFRV